MAAVQEELFLFWLYNASYTQADFDFEKIKNCWLKRHIISDDLYDLLILYSAPYEKQQVW